MNVTILSSSGSQNTETNAQSLEVNHDGQTFRFAPNSSGELCLYQGNKEIWNQKSQSRTSV